MVAQLAEKAGVDAIHVSAHQVGPARRSPMAQPPCIFVPLAEGVKKVVSIPVIVVGRISPELGEGVLRDGKADFISIGRALLADPHLPQKVAMGRMEDITPCICCLTCLDSLSWRREGVCCVVNPALGREREYELKPAESPKKVVVVGGGPGGMEAARVAALRGHKVVLFDEGDELGGQLGSTAEQNILYDVIDGRYERKKPLIGTSNRDYGTLGKLIGNQCIDRFQDRACNSRIFVFDWPSHRSGICWS